VKQSIPSRNPLLTTRAERSLAAWYAVHKRDLPWRRTRDPYPVWVSEILLQQTQVETVRPYFLRFLKAFPSVKALAAAPLDAVLKAWEGCGYYARARHLHQAAQQIVADGGKFPRTAAGWKALPGIGAYASAAIASIVFHEPVPVIDGNVERVFARLLGEKRNIKSPAVQKRLRRATEAAMQSAVGAHLDPGDFNQALMELGATLCMPRRAHCTQCPLHSQCRAFRTLPDVTVLPHKTASKPVPHYPIGAAILCKGDKLLITQRPADGLLGGLWEFPGGKCHAGESLEQCLAREIREELGIEIEVGELFASVKHAYSHFRITLHTFLCKPKAGRIKKIGIADFRWITRSELTQYAFPKADRVIIEKLLAEEGKKTERK
jgi:A/G-specific adenine glycosylase